MALKYIRMHSAKHAVNNLLHRHLNLHFITDAGAQVAPHLWIGSLASANSDFICDKKINFIVNLSGYHYSHQDVEVLNYDIEDKLIPYDLIDYYLNSFMEVAAIIKQKISEGRNVLTHCAAGINRSATSIIMYLMLENYSYEESLEKVTNANKSRGAPVLTNQSFRYLLKTCDSFKKIANLN